MMPSFCSNLTKSRCQDLDRKIRAVPVPCVGETGNGWQINYNLPNVSTEPVTVDLKPTQVSVEQGGSFTLTCKVSGRPRPNVTLIHTTLNGLQEDGRQPYVSHVTVQ